MSENRKIIRLFYDIIFYLYSISFLGFSAYLTFTINGITLILTFCLSVYLYCQYF